MKFTRIITSMTLALSSAILSFQLNAAEGVARSAFTSAIDNREPVDEISQLDTDSSRVYFFTEIKGLKGQTISHRWEQNGEVQATVDFAIGGDRWRVWSSKNLEPAFTGEWQVMVVDEAGNVLSQDSFNYGTINDTVTESSQTNEISEAEPASETVKMLNTQQTISEEELKKIAPAAGPTTSEMHTPDMHNKMHETIQSAE